MPRPSAVKRVLWHGSCSVVLRPTLRCTTPCLSQRSRSLCAGSSHLLGACASQAGPSISAVAAPTAPACLPEPHASVHLALGHPLPRPMQAAGALHGTAEGLTQRALPTATTALGAFAGSGAWEAGWGGLPRSRLGWAARAPERMSG